MKKLLNTLYVTSENSYLSLDGENVVVFEEKTEIGRVPLHNLEGIVSFGYRGTSPALMGACAERNVSLCYLTPQGRFLARVSGRIKGNVLLRQQQYVSSRDEKISLEIAKNCILGKVYNARWVLERAVRDHSMQIDLEQVKSASGFLKSSLEYIQDAQSKEQLRGYEGEAASVYSREQRAKRTCLHVHLATAARVQYPDACIASSLMSRMLASGYWTLGCLTS